MSSSNHLTKIEVENIIRLHKKGLNNRAIAKTIGRTHESVGYQLKKLGLKTNGSIKRKIEKVDSYSAKCSKCGLVRTINDFYIIRRNSEYPSRLSYCRECKKKQVYDRENSSIDVFLNRRFISLKARALRSGVEFKITRNYYKDLYNRQGGKCFYTGIVMKVQNRGKAFNDGYSMSLDRVDNKQGYVEGNVVMCLRKVNFIKNDLSFEELKEWLPSWYKKIISFI